MSIEPRTRETDVAEAVARIAAQNIPGYGADEVALFAETVFEFRPSHIFEWGTNVGASARIFYELVLLAGLECEVHTTEHPDPQTHDHPGERRGQWLEGCTVWQHIGDGLRRSLAEYANVGSPARALFFLDGDHSYDAVMRELEGVCHVAPTAVILVHDTSHPIEETEAAVDDFLIDRKPGVYNAHWLHSQAGVARLWPRSA